MAYQQEENPIANVSGALEEAFHLALDHVEPIGRRIYLAMNASDSMLRTPCHGTPQLTAAMGSAALALTIARAEPQATLAAFHDRLWRLNLTRTDRLDRVRDSFAHEPRGADASLPFHDALRRNIPVDAFIILTDNNKWASDCHPSQALDRYRRATGIAAKLVVVALSATDCVLTDPDDPLEMGVAGFDASVPEVVASFIRS